MKEYYSNCLIEALKAKLSNPEVKIVYIASKYNISHFPHILWSDSKHDYDFGTSEKLTLHNILWHKGSIRQRNLGFAEMWKQKRIDSYDKRHSQD